MEIWKEGEEGEKQRGRENEKEMKRMARPDEEEVRGR